MKENQIIEQIIKQFVAEYKEKHHTETSWRSPVTGVADAEDPKFRELKKVISTSHALPQEIVPGARTVIVYFIPFGRDIIKTNQKGEESSREWDVANIETNQLIIGLNQYCHDWIEAHGYHASLLPPTYNYDEEKLVSDWSHKSAAYIAGIGKFGVHHLLITKGGCCGRLGSIITDMPLQKSIFTEEEYCLFYRNGTCKACIKKCPIHALGEQDTEVTYDRYMCNSQIYDKIVPVYDIGTGDACGKCMCGVPCSFQNPMLHQKIQ